MSSSTRLSASTSFSFVIISTSLPACVAGCVQPVDHVCDVSLDLLAQRDQEIDTLDAATDPADQPGGTGVCALHADQRRGCGTATGAGERTLQFLDLIVGKLQLADRVVNVHFPTP